MAFVASNDKHGNQIMRVLLLAESEERTVASCQNVRINYDSKAQADRSAGHCVDADQPVGTLDWLGSKQNEPKANENSKLQLRHTEQRSKEEQLDTAMKFIDETDDKQIEEQTDLLLKEERPKIEMINQLKEELKLQPEPEQQDLSKEREAKQPLKRTDNAARHRAENGKCTIFTARTLEAKMNNKVNGDSGSSKHFVSWLAAKNEAQLQQAEDRRTLAQLDGQRAEERARLAQVKYKSWLESKAQQLQRGKSDLSSVKTTTVSQQSLSTEVSQRRLLEWEREKVAQLKVQRQARESRLMQQKIENCTRRELSTEAWAQWKDAARNKPRPVAMGCGLDSLRATNAPHFMNPNAWQSVLPDSQETLPKSQSQPRLQWRKRSPLSQLRTKPDCKRLERLALPRRSLDAIGSSQFNSSQSDMNVAQGGAKADGDKGLLLKSIHNLLKKAENQKLEKGESSCALSALAKEDDDKIISAGVNVSETSKKEQEIMVELSTRLKQLSCEESQGKAVEENETNINTRDSEEDQQFVIENGSLSDDTPEAHSQPVSIVWSKSNIKSIKELRKIVNIPASHVYRKYQLELWRKQKDDQDKKILSKKLQLKRDCLRESFKDWLINGNLSDISYNFRQTTTDTNSNADSDDSLNTQKPSKWSHFDGTDFNIETEDELLESVGPKSINMKKTNKNLLTKKPLRYRQAKQLQNAKPWR